LRRKARLRRGPAAGLAIIETLASEPALKSYHLLPSVRGDLLQRLWRLEEARAAFEIAADLAGNKREEVLLRRRADHMRRGGIGPLL
jgi:predicted RNA polymerase sigma factor